MSLEELRDRGYKSRILELEKENQELKDKWGKALQKIKQMNCYCHADWIAKEALQSLEKTNVR